MAFWPVGDHVEGERTVAEPFVGWDDLAAGAAIAGPHDMAAVVADFAINEAPGMTTRMQARCARPPRLRERVTVAGRGAEAGPRSATVETEVVDAEGKMASTATVEQADATAAIFARVRDGAPLSECARALARGRGAP